MSEPFKPPLCYYCGKLVEDISPEEIEEKEWGRVAHAECIDAFATGEEEWESL